MMNNKKWLIKGGHIVSPEWGIIETDVTIENGVITALGSHLGDNSYTVYDASGKYVFPGFIDPHVHLGNYNVFEDDCKSETISAAMGGVTTVIEYLKILRHVSEQVSYNRIFSDVFHSIDELSSIDVAFHCVISTAEHISEINDYARQGVSSFKFYLGYKGSEAALKRGAVGINDGLIYGGLSEISKAGRHAIACVHAENEEIIKYFEEKIDDKRNASFLEWANSRPNFSEAESIQRACYLANNASCPIYLCHVSARESLDEIRKMKGTSLRPIFTETCAHYLTFSKDEGNQLQGGTVKVIPPLREKESVEALWKAIDMGEIDTIGTDHIALLKCKKEHPWDGDPGFPGVETLLPLVLTGAKRRNISYDKIAKTCAHNVAQIFGLYPKKGTIRPGSDADIVLVDMNKPYRIKAEQLHSMSDFTPYEDIEVCAKVEATWLRGNLIYESNNVLEERLGQKILRS